MVAIKQMMAALCLGRVVVAGCTCVKWCQLQDQGPHDLCWHVGCKIKIFVGRGAGVVDRVGGGGKSVINV